MDALTEFTQDLYDVLGMNKNFCTQEQFFEKYVETDDAFMVDQYKGKGFIYFDDFTITITPNN